MQRFVTGIYRRERKGRFVLSGILLLVSSAYGAHTLVYTAADFLEINFDGLSPLTYVYCLLALLVGGILLRTTRPDVWWRDASVAGASKVSHGTVEVSAVIESLNAGNRRLRTQAINALRELIIAGEVETKEKQVVVALTTALETNSPWPFGNLWFSIIELLGMMGLGAQQSIPVLLKVMKRYQFSRLELTQGAGSVRSMGPGAILVLKKARKDKGLCRTAESLLSRIELLETGSEANPGDAWPQKRKRDRLADEKIAKLPGEVRDVEISEKCSQCGHTHVGLNAACLICGAPKSNS